MIKAHQYLSEIENYVPGKSKISNNQKVIKLSSNENALGSSPKAMEAYKNHKSEIFRYADGSCHLLRDALAEKYKISAERIVCGAGSDEIIALLASAFARSGDEIIYSEHGFLMYPISAKRVGATAVRVRETGLKADVDAIIATVSKRTKIIFLANPNNPTGSYVDQEQIEKLIAKVSKDVLIVLDSAYEEFVDKKDFPDVIKLVNKHENVVMTRTFSKIYGLASLRIGWCYSSKYVADILNKMRGPFNVGGPAQVAAVAALEDDEFLQKSKEHNQKWLKIIFEKVAASDKIRAWPSIANFILLDFFSPKKCREMNEKLLAEGVILREMDGYGLPSCLRMTIGSDEENEKVMRILFE